MTHNNLTEAIEARMMEAENIFPRITEIQKQFLVALCESIAQQTATACEVKKQIGTTVFLDTQIDALSSKKATWFGGDKTTKV